MNPLTISPVDAEALYDGKDGYSSGPWDRVADERTGDTRWMEQRRLILRHRDTDTYWELSYEVGLTEVQETEWPWESDEPIDLDRVYPHEVTRTVYRDTPPVADRDHIADARRIALDHIADLADFSPMLMAEVLDAADLTDHDTDLIAEDLGVLVGMLADLVNGWDGGGDA